jgi:protein-disulfide isomerase
MDSKSSPITLPAAIIIAGAIIAMAILWVKKPSSPPAAMINDQEPIINLVPVSGTDHILGNPAAPVVIVEYSDASCPFCKMYHGTMRDIMNEYGADGRVAWVYRHFPIDKPGTRPDGTALHPNAGNEAQAMECAAEQGGNEKFWAYANRLFEITPSVTPQSPGGLDQAELPVIARDVGLDVIAFTDCLASGRFKDLVEQHYVGGLNAGVNGTPHSFILANGETEAVNGTLPYATLKAVIDAALAGARR